MPIGLLFWILMILWILSIVGAWRNPQWPWAWPANAMLAFVLFFLLGWHDFGFILQGGGGAPFR
jgi:hypothetical protein